MNIIRPIANIIGQIVNKLTQWVLGVRIFDFFDQIAQTKTQIKRASQKAQLAQWQEAVQFTQNILQTWSYSPSWFEERLRKRYLDHLLKEAKKQQRRYKTVIKGEDLFSRGIRAEKAGNLDKAKQNYQLAAAHLPESHQCYLRLGMIAIKTQDWSQAIAYVSNLNNESAIYIRGFAHAKLQQYPQAQQAWRSLSHSQVQSQLQLLQSIEERPKLQAEQDIEALVVKGNLKDAKKKSEEFIQQYGEDTHILTNLYQYILPTLKMEAWQTQDWKTVLDIAQTLWLNQPSITSLHNWALASYYYTHQNPDYFLHLVVIWVNNLANIHLNPHSNQDSSSQSEIYQQFKQLLENLIDETKEENLDRYFQLRDYYSLDTTAIKLSRNPGKGGMYWHDFYITPGFYQFYHDLSPNSPKLVLDDLEPATAKMLSALYTSWGLAMIACLNGDIERAIILKPDMETNRMSNSQRYGQNFVCYHEGCHYLKKNQWRKAVIPLKKANKETKICQDWYDTIDELCNQQRQAIRDEQEHLEFAEVWHELLESQRGKRYLAEYRAESIRSRLIEEELSFKQALDQLYELLNLDPQNSVVLDLIKKIEINTENLMIQSYLKDSNLSEALRIANSSRHQEVKYKLANCCIEMIVEVVKQGEVNDNIIVGIRQMGEMAYELCPDEPSFQEIYRLLRII